MDDLKRALAEVSGDAAFADDFFSRYIQGHEVVDYQTLLARARPGPAAAAPGSGAFIGSLRLEDALRRRARRRRCPPDRRPSTRASIATT